MTTNAVRVGAYTWNVSEVKLVFSDDDDNSVYTTETIARIIIDPHSGLNHVELPVFLDVGCEWKRQEDKVYQTFNGALLAIKERRAAWT